jgi:transcriptional regulator with XRE-family HTH domain
MKVGTTKSYISRIENNVKEVRISTLQKIVEIGLGGQLQLSIKLSKYNRIQHPVMSNY